MSKWLKHIVLLVAFFIFWVDPILGSKIPKIQLMVYADSLLIESKILSKVDSTALVQTKNRTVRDFADKGFLFCSAQFDSTIFNKDTLKLWVKKGPLIRMNQLVMGPTEKNKTINKKLVYAITQVKPNQICNATFLQKFDSKVQNCGFYTLSKASEFSFTDDSLSVYSYLENKQNNSINGIIGFLPSDGNRTVFSGDFSLALNNIFQFGEEIRAKWQSYKPLSQQASVQVLFPYLLYSPIGIQANLNLVKNDSTFLSSKQQIGATYALAPNHRIAVNWNRKVSSNLSTETQNNSSIFNGFGLEYFIRKSDNLPIPRRFTSIQVGGNIGSKTIDSEIFNQLTTAVKATFTLKLNRYFGWTTTLHSEAIFSEKIISNEQFLIGGFNSLRGFNELNFLASQYATAQNEIRFHLDSGSYLLGLFDVGTFSNTETFDTPFGFGLGYALATKNGLFSINYALGQSKIQPLRFQSSKVHFGFIGNL